MSTRLPVSPSAPTVLEDAGLDLQALDLTVLDIATIESLAPTRVLDLLTANLLSSATWADGAARELTAVLEDPLLPQASRDALVSRLAEHVHVQDASAVNDPYGLFTLGEAILDPQHSVTINPEARKRLARALGGYPPVRVRPV